MQKLFVAAMAVCVLLALPNFASASVIIQTVQIGSPAAADEFITLFNPDDLPQDLSGWSVQEKSDTAATINKKNFVAGMKIPAHSSVLIANGGGIYAPQALMTYASFSLPEGGATIVIAPTTTLLISFPDAPSNAAVYHYGSAAATSSTPQTPTSPAPITQTTASSSAISAAPDIFFSHADPPPYKIQISELFPHPTNFLDEFIELYNPNDVAVSVGGDILEDASGNSYSIGTRSENSILMPKEFRAWPRSITGIALNDTDGEEITLATSQNAFIDEATYHNDAPINASYSHVHESWHWTAAPTPNAPNIFDELPAPPIARAIIPPGPFFVGDSLVCSATDTTDPNNDITKYNWNFGDGSYSDTVLTQHAYATSGTYLITFTATDSKGLSSAVARQITVKEKTTTIPEPASPISASTINTNYVTSTPHETKKITTQNSSPNKPNTYSGVVTITPGVLGARTLVVDNRTVEFTTVRSDIEKLVVGTLVHFSAHEIFRGNRLILQVSKKDKFLILGTAPPRPADIIFGTVKDVSKNGTTLSTSSSDILLLPKGMPITVPQLYAGDLIEIHGILLADETAPQIIIPTEKIIVQPQQNKNSAVATGQGFLLMYGSGILLIIIYFVFTKKRALANK